MDILANATRHFKQKIAGKKITIRVPEWDTKKNNKITEKCEFYMRPFSCCSGVTTSKIKKYMENEDVESMVDIIILLATDSISTSEGDDFVFKGKVARHKLLMDTDPAIITRIFVEWSHADEGLKEDIKKQ